VIDSKDGMSSGERRYPDTNLHYSACDDFITNRRVRWGLIHGKTITSPFMPNWS